MPESSASPGRGPIPTPSEKTVFVRGPSGSRVFTLSRRRQMILGGLAAAALLWTVAATATLAVRGVGAFAVADGGVEAGQRRVAALEAAHDEARDAALLADQALERLAARHEALSRSIAEKAALQETAETLDARLAALEAERARLEDAAIEARAAEAAAETARALAEAEARELAQTLDQVAAALDETAGARDDAVETVRQIEDALDSLEAGVERASDRRQRVLAQIEEAAALSLGNLETMLAAAGVDVDALLERLRAESDGRGGPFVAAPIAAAEALPEPERAIALSVMSDLERVNLMRLAALRLPFAKPVDRPRYTSFFGMRRDPINGRRARHEGVDIAGRSGTPIHATADGVVSFSGSMRGYGRVVKIRHDLGFETVYAHLRRARVAKGDRVTRGARIGDMGNTGRSTGTHLHYEVRVDGRAVDPMKFIKASSDVL